MSKKSKKSKVIGQAKSLQSLPEEIIKFLDNNISRAYSPKQISKKMGISDSSSKLGVQTLLSQLSKEGKVERIKSTLYRSAIQAAIHVGTVDHVNSKFAYIICDDLEDDVWVKTQDLKYAMDKDRVTVAITNKAKHGRRPEGEVTEILERSISQLVGRLELSTRYAFVIADNKRVYQDIFIRPSDALKAKNNDKVIVEITQWPGASKSPEGKVVRVLGASGEHNAEIHSIMAEFDLPFGFPENVESDANSISPVIKASEIKKRRDLRDVTTFTIDPEDAKDFDDALSFQKLENGNTEVGIHIADVSHYVKEDSHLEKEAFKRATSVYLVDRTIPMLPEKLSNGLCSLRPNEDKLTFSAIFELDDQANVKQQWFGRTIIHSDRRFSYEEAQEVIESKKGDHASELEQLNALALTLKDERFKNGAINFETTEVKFNLAEDGTPLGIIPKERKDAHKLIEEFMLLANKKVAQYIFGMKKGKAKNTFVYRSHDNPNPDKISSFSIFAKKFGHSLDGSEGNISSSLNRLMEDIEGRPEQNVLQTIAIRSMAKAKYTTEPDGHFGLAFDHYSHFTSPIRRYPDVMVHRLLQHYLDKGSSVDAEVYEEKCKHSSDMEKRASDAERASIKFKQVEFMSTVENIPFEGIVSGVTEWGIFVEITETKCEGMVRMSQLTDDFYEFDEANYRVIGKRNKRMFTLGDNVVVKVVKTDINRRTIDLEFVNDK